MPQTGENKTRRLQVTQSAYQKKNITNIYTPSNTIFEGYYCEESIPDTRLSNYNHRLIHVHGHKIVPASAF